MRKKKLEVLHREMVKLVERGCTVTSIARRYGISVEELTKIVKEMA